MKKNLILKLSCFSFISLVPWTTLSCITKFPNDKENLIFNDSSFNENQKIEIILNNQQPKILEEIYSKNILSLISEVKNSYRNYKQQYFKLIRKYNSLKTKVFGLINLQEEKNGIEIQKFYNKWFDDEQLIKINSEIKKPKLSVLLNKYQLIFSDVDAVIGDLNLNIDNKEYLKRIKVIDQRLSGIDINLGELQENIVSSWNFLKSNLFDETNITQKEKIEDINIEDDKNSHSHSHAIVNLVYEMGLWHQLLTDNAKNQDQIKQFKEDFENFKKNVIINIDQVDYQVDFDFIIKVFANNMDLNQKNNLTNKEFQNQAKMYMQKTKEILLAIAKKEGIKDSEINPLLK